MLRYVGILPLACFLIASLASCGNSGYHMPSGTADPTIESNKTVLDAYTLQHEDKLSIRFFYNPELNQDIVVGRDGKIALQLIGGVSAAGLYPSDLESIIFEHYAKILRNPEVTVAVQQYAPRLFYIFGEVNQPGGYPHELGMTVVNAVALARGFTYRAKGTEVRIVRGDDPTRRPQDASQQTPVLPGDVIEVPERYF